MAEEIAGSFEVAIGRTVIQVAAADAKALRFYDAVLRVLGRIDLLTIDAPNGEPISFRLPAEIVTRSLPGPEPEWVLEPWLTEAGARLLRADLDASERRWSEGILDPERACPRCRRWELQIVVRDDWTRLVWRCAGPDCGYETEAWPPGRERAGSRRRAGR